MSPFQRWLEARCCVRLTAASTSGGDDDGPSRVEWPAGDVDFFTFQRTLRRAWLEDMEKDADAQSAVLRSLLDDYVDGSGDDFALRSLLCPYGQQVMRASSQSSESVMKALLSVDAIQPELLDMLLERLATFDSTEDEDDRSRATMTMSVASQSQRHGYGSKATQPKLFPQILRQLRWLEHVVDGKRLTRKLLDIIAATDGRVQRALITTLPEIVTDGEHGVVVAELKAMLDVNADLMAHVLDALSHLTLEERLLNDLRNAVATKLDSAEIEDLPAMLHFLFRTASTSNAMDLVTLVRDNLNMESLYHEPNETAVAAPILDAFRAGIRFNRAIKDSWMKLIVNDKGNGRPMDVLLLFILHSIDVALKKKVSTCFRGKIAEGRLDTEMVAAVITGFPGAAKEYFRDIIALNEELVRTDGMHGLAGEYAKAVYSALFGILETFHQQEIIGSLVSHIGSGTAAEVSTSLAILEHIIQTAGAHEVAPYTPIIKGTLDYVDNLTLDSVKALYGVICALVIEDGEVVGGSLLSELVIMIRKQLTHMELRYRAYGVAGSVALLRWLGAKRVGSASGTDGTSASGSSSQRSSSARMGSGNQAVRHAIKILELVVKTCQHCMTSRTLFYDEVTTLIASGQLDPAIEIWAHSKIVFDFLERFMVNTEEVNEELARDKYGIYLAIDKDAPVAVNILPICDSSVGADESGGSSTNGRNDVTVVNSVDRFRQNQIQVLCPLFRLMAVCERKSSGSLEAIDAVLGCGLVLFPNKFSLTELKQLDASQRKLYAFALFHAINWMREVVNAFVTEQDAEMQVKCVRRISHIMEMETLLKELLRTVSHFDALDFLAEALTSPGDHGTWRGGPRKATATALKREKENERENAMDDDESRPTGSVRSSEEIGSRSGNTDKKLMDLRITNLLRECRDINLDVFTLLTFDAEYRLSDEEEIASGLSSEQTLFLLRNLHEKVTVKLDTSSSNFGRPEKKGMGPLSLSAISKMEPMQFVDHIILELAPTLAFTIKKMMAKIVVQDDDVGMFLADENSVAPMECLTVTFDILRRIAKYLAHPTRQYNKRFKALSKRISETLLDDASLSLDPFAVVVAYLLELVPKMPVASLCLPILQCVVQYQETLRIVDPRKCADVAKVADACAVLLSNEWPDAKRLQNSDIKWIIMTQIEYAPEPWELVRELVDVAFPALEHDREDVLEGFPLLNRATFATFYQAALVGLRISFRRMSTEVPKGELFTVMHRNSNSFHKLMELGKRSEKRAVIGHALKNARHITDAFCKLCIPIMDAGFARERVAICDVFKAFQMGTRLAQHMCTHSKDVKDAQLTAAVPACRKSLESFILVVKALLKKHNALSALTIGVLKHRNLQGDIIPSQRAEASDDSDRDDYRLVETKVPRKRKMAPTATGSSSSSKKTTKRKPKRGSSDVESMDEDAAEEREAEADRSEQRLSSTYIADSDDSDEDVSEEDAEDGEDDG